MLDIGWWELAVIGMVALIVVGPAELPALLRTIGRYVGMAKRQADEFRSQFDEALRESEFDDLRKEMDNIKSDVTSSLDDAQASVNKELSDYEHDWDKDGAIEPAPEFANDPPTTSFTMPDGEVVRKIDDVADGAAAAKDAAPAKPVNGAATEPAATETTKPEATKSEATDGASPRDAEAVR